MNVVLRDPPGSGDPVSQAGGQTPPPKPPMQRRSADREFREALSRGLVTARKSLIVVALFSFAVKRIGRVHHIDAGAFPFVLSGWLFLVRSHTTLLYRRQDFLSKETERRGYGLRYDQVA